MNTARPYQLDALAGIRSALAESESALLVLPTGTGKTFVFSSYVKERASAGDRCLILAHRTELIDQARRRLMADAGFGVMDVGIEQAGRRSSPANPVVVASVQSLHEGRLKTFPRDDFYFGVIDECFPAGTLIDGRPIETIEPGDTVPSWDPIGHHLHRRRVTATMRRRPVALVRVVIDGEAIACTPPHPFYTSNGWKLARNLRHGDSVLAWAHHASELYQVRQGDRGPAGLENRPLPEDGASVLLEGVHGGVGPTPILGEAGANKPPLRERAHEAAQPYATTSGAPEDGGDPAAHRPSTTRPGRKRQGSYGAAGATCGGIEVGDRGDRSDRLAGQGGAAEPLQTRHREPRGEDCDRGGRGLSRVVVTPGTGPEERGVSRWARVESVEVLQPGSDGRFGGLCSDGAVYNLEVEKTHTYLVGRGGFVVHNCHHAPADSYRRIMKHFAGAQWLGVTATPDRADGQGLRKSFDTIAYVYEIRDAIADGWLVPIKAALIEVEGLDLSRVRTTAGDLNEKDLAEVMERESNLHAVAKPALAEVGERPALCFASSVAHAHELARVLNNYRPACARAVDGTTESQVRAEVLRHFEERRFQFLVNCALFTEGVDLPLIGAIVMARPTESRALYAQMVGRGTRLLGQSIEQSIAAGKPDLLVLDFVGNAGKHKLVCALDILDSSTDENVRKRAIDKAKAGAIDVGEALETAAREEVEQQRLALTVDVKWRRIEITDQFTLLGVRPRAGRWGGATATAKQLDFLRRVGIVKPEQLDKGQASQVIDAWMRRREAGLCSLRQAKILMGNGLSPDVTYERASEVMAALKANRWKPTPELLAAPDLVINREQLEARRAKLGLAAKG